MQQVDCPRLPMDESITAPLVNGGEELSQLVLDLKTSGAVVWDKVNVFYDESVVAVPHCSVSACIFFPHLHRPRHPPSLLPGPLHSSCSLTFRDEFPTVLSATLLFLLARLMATIAHGSRIVATQPGCTTCLKKAIKLSDVTKKGQYCFNPIFSHHQPTSHRDSRCRDILLFHHDSRCRDNHPTSHCNSRCRDQQPTAPPRDFLMFNRKSRFRDILLFHRN
uniref:(California timema) hypothetical protein n=1 Tax=Timema californicum TaxID=61474 RepID=A0A7R9JAV2_TIMCA|nr:unnamed protein product [Timema californicum]